MVLEQISNLHSWAYCLILNKATSPKCIIFKGACSPEVSRGPLVFPVRNCLFLQTEICWKAKLKWADYRFCLLQRVLRGSRLLLLLAPSVSKSIPSVPSLPQSPKVCPKALSLGRSFSSFTSSHLAVFSGNSMYNSPVTLTIHSYIYRLKLYTPPPPPPPSQPAYRKFNLDSRQTHYNLIATKLRFSLLTLNRLQIQSPYPLHWQFTGVLIPRSKNPWRYSWQLPIISLSCQ